MKSITYNSLLYYSIISEGQDREKQGKGKCKRRNKLEGGSLVSGDSFDIWVVSNAHQNRHFISLSVIVIGNNRDSSAITNVDVFVNKGQT